MESWAFTTLQMVMGENVISEIVSEKTASGIWSKLESLYLMKTLTNRLLLMRSCLFFKMKEGTTVKYHMTEFEDIVMKLKATDALLAKDEEALAMILLYSLPEKYSHFTNSYIYMRIGNNPRENYNQGLFATRGREDKQSSKGRNRRRSQSRRPGSRRKSKVRGNCNYCHKPGHWVKDCLSLKNEDKDNVVSLAAKEEVAFCAEEEEDAFCATVTSPYVDRRWVLDTDASCHMTPFRDSFVTFKKLEGNSIHMGNGTSCARQGIGTVKIKMFDGYIRTFKTVKYVPSMTRSLISVRLLSRAGYRTRIEDEILRISRGMVRLYLLNHVWPKVLRISMHLRLGHTSVKNLEILHKRNLIKVSVPASLDFCSGCVEGKQTHVSFGVAKHNTKGIIDYVHTDVWGPSNTPSLSGGKYFVSFIDDFSHKFYYVLKLKSDVFETFKTWLARVEVEIGKKLKVLRFDNSGEFTSGNFKDIYLSEGIHRHYTTPDDPQSIGVSERMNRTLLEKVRCMLLTSGFPKSFWAEALNAAVHIMNRLPCSAIGGKILKEVWRDKRNICLKYICVFGCPIYVHVSGQDKLDPKAIRRSLLDYTYGIKGYRIWNPLTHSRHSRHVRFNEPVHSQDPEVITIVAHTADDVETVVSPNIPSSSTLDVVPESPAVEEVIPPVTSTSDSEEEILTDGGD
ncbi:hypothetical protein OSB04_019498 [Centaurea solstitialis]|uniref:Integrase catalytic domain-containing protein n=1 Tax=Centaurea solstitialis TaxID=347529 RepID=A0AA38T2Q9_9ASTR|nr:hypothetical protein OSB04_019498 [Centaurea solstitialis]